MQPTVTTITVETLDKDSVPGLVSSANELIHRGYIGGSLRAKDGDYISWSTKEQPIEVSP